VEIARWGENRKRESSESSRLASTKEYKEHTEVFGVGKLL